MTRSVGGCLALQTSVHTADAGGLKELTEDSPYRTLRMADYLWALAANDCIRLKDAGTKQLFWPGIAGPLSRENGSTKVNYSQRGRTMLAGGAAGGNERPCSMARCRPNSRQDGRLTLCSPIVGNTAEGLRGATAFIGDGNGNALSVCIQTHEAKSDRV
jgi:hypothetical protein